MCSPVLLGPFLSRCFSRATRLPGWAGGCWHCGGRLCSSLTLRPAPLPQGSVSIKGSLLTSKENKNTGTWVFSYSFLYFFISCYLSKCASSSGSLSSTVSLPIPQIPTFEFYPFSRSSPDQIPPSRKSAFRNSPPCYYTVFIWHHWLDGRGSEWTPGVGDGQGGLACCDSWGRKESDTTERLIWSDLIWYLICLMCLSFFEGKARIEASLFPIYCLIMNPALGGDLWGSHPSVENRIACE